MPLEPGVPLVPGVPERVARHFQQPRALLLLQERLPASAPVIGVSQEEETLFHMEQPKTSAVAWQVPVATAFPMAHYLTNGRYGVLITNAGSGYSRWQETDLTRWRADTTRDDWGTWIYIQDRDSGQLWSASRQPLG